MKQICQQSRAVWVRPIQLVAQLLLLLWLSGSVIPTVSGADRIILRNLKVINDKTVVSFDEDGIRLNDGQLLAWYDIERAKIAEDKQVAFNKMLADLGNHLYRIRQRLKVGDYEGLVPHAEAVEQRFVGRTSDTAYTVMQSLMWGKLASGQREAALAPYLRCYNILRQRRKVNLPLPGERKLVFDPQTAITTDITPVWFDKAAAKAELSNVYSVIRKMKPIPDGVLIYYASLAASAGEDETAQKVLGHVQSKTESIQELHKIVAAQRDVLKGSTRSLELELLQDELDNFSDDHKPLGLYWLGRSKLALEQTEVQQQGLLDLLRVPAVHGDRRPQLAGAALRLSMQKLSEMKDVRGSVALRGELLAKYGGTFAAKQISREAKSKSQP